MATSTTERLLQETQVLPSGQTDVDPFTKMATPRIRNAHYQTKSVSKNNLKRKVNPIGSVFWSNNRLKRDLIEHEHSPPS